MCNSKNLVKLINDRTGVDMKIDPTSFPKLPAHQYTSYPIYLEAIHKVIRTETIEAMYGSRAKSFIGLIDLCAKSIEEHLISGESFDTWVPPLSGIHKGKAHSERAHDSTDHLRLGTRIYSSMGFIPSEAEFEEEVSLVKKDRWIDLVRKELLKKAPYLDNNFSRSFNVNSKARSTVIDYVGKHYAVNLCKLDPGQNFTNHIRITKSKLWDMEALRDSGKGMFKDQLENFEVIVWRPDEDSPAYSQRQITSLNQALSELMYEGDKHNLPVIPVNNQRDAACRILQYQWKR